MQWIQCLDFARKKYYKMTFNASINKIPHFKWQIDWKKVSFQKVVVLFVVDFIRFYRICVHFCERSNTYPNSKAGNSRQTQHIHWHTFFAANLSKISLINLSTYCFQQPHNVEHVWWRWWHSDHEISNLLHFVNDLKMIRYIISWKSNRWRIGFYYKTGGSTIQS